MPTGYTACIEDNPDITFEEFALRCARVFGALVTMRDEPLGATIPDEFQPSDYHLNAYESSKEEYDRWSTATEDEVKAHVEALYRERVRSVTAANLKTAANVVTCQNLLRSVTVWKPPSSEHADLKTFMIKQLNDYLRRDVYYRSEPKPEKPDAWLLHELDTLKSDVEYHDNAYKEECARVDSHNKWVRQLRESLKN
jgi:hypothetical protein